MKIENRTVYELTELEVKEAIHEWLLKQCKPVAPVRENCKFKPWVIPSPVKPGKGQEGWIPPHLLPPPKPAERNSPDKFGMIIEFTT